MSELTPQEATTVATYDKQGSRWRANSAKANFWKYEKVFLLHFNYGINKFVVYKRRSNGRNSVTTTIVAPATLTGLAAIELGNKAYFVCETGARHGLSQSAWERLVTLIVANMEFQHEFGNEEPEIQGLWAGILLDQALGFLWLAGVSDDEAYGPSHLVDIAWHVFMLDSVPYFRFCEVNFGRYIHHNPIVVEVLGKAKGGGVKRTVAAMRARDISVIEAVWMHAKFRGQCECDGPCSD